MIQNTQKNQWMNDYLSLCILQKERRSCRCHGVWRQYGRWLKEACCGGSRRVIGLDAARLSSLSQSLHRWGYGYHTVAQPKRLLPVLPVFRSLTKPFLAITSSLLIPILTLTRCDFALIVDSSVPLYHGSPQLHDIEQGDQRLPRRFLPVHSTSSVVRRTSVADCLGASLECERIHGSRRCRIQSARNKGHSHSRWDSRTLSYIHWSSRRVWTWTIHASIPEGHSSGQEKDDKKIIDAEKIETLQDTGSLNHHFVGGQSSQR